MLQLSRELIHKIWPKERLVMGLRVCRELHKILFGSEVLLKSQFGLWAKASADQDVQLRIFADLSAFESGESPVYLGVSCISLPTLKGSVTCLSNALGFSTSTLVQLDLRGSRIGDQGLGWLCNGLRQCRNLEHLNLSDNGIRGTGLGAEGLKSLADASKLRHLDLSKNQIGHGGMATAGLEDLGAFSTLTSLQLQQNEMYHEGAEWLEKALLPLKQLIFLDLSRNRIGTERAGRLAEILVECKGLKYFSLYLNEVDDEGAQRLSRTLEQYKSLSTLDLGLNRVRNAGATKLAMALKQCPSLTQLNLRYNNVGETGKAALLQAATLNPQLELLL